MRPESSCHDRLYITIEKLAHVKRLVLTAHGLNAHVDLELNRARVITDSDSIELLFDCHIAPHRARSTRTSSGVISLTCPITLDMKRDHDLDLPSAAELSSRQDLLCRSCGRLVAHLSRLDKVLPLPSEHWIDMAELWVCDPHIMSKTDHPYGLPGHRLDEAAIDNVMLVGVRDLILPTEAVVSDESCECDQDLGESVPGGIRFWKRSIRVADEPLFSFYTIETDAVATILQHCHSQSRYMIELTNPDDEQRIYMQILNWDSFAIQAVYQVVDGALQLERRLPSNEKRFVPVMKVLFAIRDRISILPASFSAAKKFESLQLTSMQFEAVSAALRSSNEVFPPIQRQLGDMSIAILRRLSRIV